MSIGVFGRPGTGKSFTVREIVRSLRINEDTLEFNLAQMNDLTDLSHAFQRIQTAGLRGKLPVVFWDEFDSVFNGRFGWVRHFLAPMQDGQFRVQGDTHYFGRAIFVFAGGVCNSARDFVGTVSNEPEREMKLLDFVSRLKAMYDVPGVDFPDRPSQPDKLATMIRRALVVRHQLQTHVPHVRSVDTAVIVRLLSLNYRSGARSVESIIEASTLADDSHFSATALPSDDVLSLHVANAVQCSIEGRAFRSSDQSIQIE
jgi:hypothetical protein